MMGGLPFNIFSKILYFPIPLSCGGVKKLGLSVGQEYLHSFTNAVVWNVEVTNAVQVRMMIQVFHRE